MSEDSIEILIVGAGVAGLTAAFFGARAGRSTRVLCPEGPGGCLVSVDAVEDFPGFVEPIPGFELCPGLQEQAQTSGATFVTAALTSLRAGDGGDWRVATDQGPLRAQAVIIASGTAPMSLGVPGEDALAGRGVIHCASCDGPIYRDRHVAVVGNGDAALSEALTFSRCGARVSLLTEDDSVVGQDVYRRNVIEDPSIFVRTLISVQKVLGDDVVSGVLVAEQGGPSQEFAVDGLLVAVGRVPATDFLGDVVELDQDRRIRTDAGMHTSARGIFAAGDVRAQSPFLAISAAGDGAVAATSADQYLSATDRPRRAITGAHSAA